MDVLQARKAQAKEIAYLINLAGDGIPYWLWEKQKHPAQTTLEYGESKAQRDSGNFSYTNTLVCAIDGELAGMLLSYQLDDPYDLAGVDELPGVVQPLVKLESYAAGSWYVNALATFDSYRGKGVGSLLLDHSESLAKANHVNCLSLIVDSNNLGAIRLYEKIGFGVEHRLPQESAKGLDFDGDWLLMLKQLV